jgi:hypothetical protein
MVPRLAVPVLRFPLTMMLHQMEIEAHYQNKLNAAMKKMMERLW